MLEWCLWTKKHPSEVIATNNKTIHFGYEWSSGPAISTTNFSLQGRQKTMQRCSGLSDSQSVQRMIRDPPMNDAKQKYLDLTTIIP